MRAAFPITVLALALSGCGSSDNTDGDTPTPQGTATPTLTPTPQETATPTLTPTPTNSVDPSLYAFSSTVGEGSSVSYSGQVMRHVLIDDMKSWIGGLTASIDGGAYIPAEGDVAAGLNFYYRFDSSVGGELPILLSTAPEPLQSIYNDISTDKDITGKIAGNDPVGQHKDWSEGIVGWEEGTSPEALVESLFSELDDLAVKRANGEIPRDLNGLPLEAVYITEDALDIQQLLQKFLLGAVCFSQGADDYLDDDEAGKGLLSDNTAAASEGGSYTALEHAWDEGFGYFGAARNYLSFTDEEIAAAGGREPWSGSVYDLDGDGFIDLKAEANLGHSQNAAKRDLGSSAASPTDYTEAAFQGFLEGRRVIHSAGGEALSTEEMEALKGHRDQAVQAWEAAISATVVHYINDMLQDITAYEGDGFSFSDYAKHFSEMKGFALSLQFNPRSPLSESDAEAFHALVGTRPVLPNDDNIAAYQEDLLEARALLGAAYGFDDSNLGDENGLNGW